MSAQPHSINATPAAAPATLTVRRLQPTFAAEISGVDLRQPLTPELRDEIRALVVKYKVISFRDQHLSREQLAQFGSSFGPQVIHPLLAKKERETGIDATQPKGVHNIQHGTRAEYERKGRTLHADGSWQSPVAFATILHGANVPDVGGDTIFVDAGAVYAGLPKALKARIEGKYATHEYRELQEANVAHPIIAHPLVVNHPETGEDTLNADFIMSPQVLGVELAESEAILAALYLEALRPEYSFHFHWTKGAVVMWDNRSTLHTVAHNYGDFPRVLDRVVVAGNDIPFRDPAKRFVAAD